VTLLALLLCLAFGGVVGVASGLLGIGGGILIVPFLYVLLEGSGWSGVVSDPAHHATLAHATSLAVILPTSISGLVAYRKAGVVSWSLVLPLGVVAGVAAIGGAAVATYLPGQLLRLSFATFLVIIGLQLLGVFSARKKGGEGAKASEPAEVRDLALFQVLGGGALTGFLSALLGIGGGLVAIPILIHWARLELHRVAAASIGIVVFAASAGMVTYIGTGWSVPGLPAGSQGFIFLPAALAMAPGAVLMAPYGARLNQRLPVPVLRRIFGGVLLTVAARLFLGS